MKDTIGKAEALRKILHDMPESSGCETRTKQTLMYLLKKETDLEIVDKGNWFYAAHREDPGAEGMALRADMDAVSGASGRPYHGGGHDGHMSVMAALAAYTTGKTFGKNLFFLFQHAEETGTGAEECCEIFDLENIGSIYGFHNCPGFPEGAVLMQDGTFACASKGLILSFGGVQSHAAYPENGNNPVFPIAEFFGKWQEMTDPGLYGGMTMATPVGVSAGSRSFGVAAGDGEINLTLRAWNDADLEKLEKLIIDTASLTAEKAGVTLTAEEIDVFPATVNAAGLYKKAEAAAKKAGLQTMTPDEPFRWSEDFGHYGARCMSFFFGIGGGTEAAGLHTPDYEWNTAVTEAALKLFSALIKM